MPTVNPEVIGGNPELSRRQRVHRATREDLVSAARALLVEQGLSAVTVRAVAARLGMTAPAIYRYYESRELLLEGVVDLLYGELATHLEQACESRRSGTLTDRFLVTSRAFRVWALQNRAEFGLLFGAPIPGVGRKEEVLPLIADDSRGKRFMLVWLNLFREIPAAGIMLPPWPRPIAPGLRLQLERYVERLGDTADSSDASASAGGATAVDLAMVFLVSWQSLYGFICTEAFGHLNFAIDDGAELFEDRLQDFRERLLLP